MNEPIKYDISILVLCYNAEHYIVRCLESIVSQEFTGAVQVVIMDDCSSDATPSIIEEFQKQSNSKRFTFKVITQNENVGCYANMIDGLSHCEAPIIAYVEADDYWIDNTKLQFQFDFLLKNENYSGIGTGCQFVNELGEPTKQLYYTQAECKSYNHSDSWSYPQFQTSAFVFRYTKPLLYKSNLKFSQCNDKILFEHLTKTNPIFYDPRKTTAYRTHQHNITSQNSKTSIFLHHLKVNTRLLKNSGLKNVFKYMFACMKLTYIWIHDIAASR